MSQDIVADALNQIMNAKRAGKPQLALKHSSNFLLSVLALAKLKGYVKSYVMKDKMLEVEVGDKLNACMAIKPRYLVKSDEIMKYARRYLPSRDMGIIVVSTSKGLMTHHSAIEKNIGGSIIAYFY